MCYENLELIEYAVACGSIAQQRNTNLLQHLRTDFWQIIKPLVWGFQSVESRTSHASEILFFIACMILVLNDLKPSTVASRYRVIKRWKQTRIYAKPSGPDLLPHIQSSKWLGSGIPTRCPRYWCINNNAIKHAGYRCLILLTLDFVF